MNRNPAPVKLPSHLLMVDEARCTGCNTCTVACKLEHGWPAGPRPIKVFAVGPVETGSGPAMNHVAVFCRHCERPACVTACPTGAMQKSDDGIVFSDPDLCIGCQTCAAACPFGVPELNPDAGKIVKCDGCRARVAQGMWPVCVLKCPTGSLRFSAPDRVVQERRTATAVRIESARVSCKEIQ